MNGSLYARTNQYYASKVSAYPVFFMVLCGCTLFLPVILIYGLLVLYGDTFLASDKISNDPKKIIPAISEYRTASMGAHKMILNECGHTKPSYNSCRNRHCLMPDFQWIDKQRLCLLLIDFFHILFTIPDTLNLAAYQNQRIVYRCTIGKVTIHQEKL